MNITVQEINGLRISNANEIEQQIHVTKRLMASMAIATAF